MQIQTAPGAGIPSVPSGVGPQSVGTQELKDSSVTLAKLASDVVARLLSSGRVGTSELVSGSVTVAKLASDVLSLITSTANGILPIAADELAAGAGSGVATKYVAASDSDANSQNRADYVCDGTSDQTEINNALNALPENGGTVYLAEGTYTVDGSITIPDSDIALVGAGASTVLKGNAAIDVISASNVSSLLIQNLRIDGNAETASDGISFSNVTNSEIVSCWVENLGNYGIYLDSSSNNTISRNMSSGNGWDGIYLKSSSNNIVTGNISQRNAFKGLYLDYLSDNNIVSSNIFHGNSGSGIYLENSDNNVIAGNTCSGNSNEGIRLDNSNNTLITSNHNFNNSTGIGVGSGSENSKLASNYSHGNTVNLSDNGTATRYIETADLDNNAVTSDKIGTGAGSGVATKYVAASDSDANSQNRADYVCDGVGENDENEINQAIAALPDNGGSVYLAEGIYTIGDNIIINKSNVTLIGAGPSTMIILKDSHDGNIGMISAEGKSNLLIKNLRIDGNDANQTTGTMYGIYFSNVTNSEIVNNWVENLENYGIYLVSSSNNTVSANICEGNTEDGIVLSSSDNNTVTGNTSVRNTNYGIKLNSSSNNSITGNACRGNGWDGIYLESSNQNNITGNNFQDHLKSIYLKSSSNNIISGNIGWGNSDDSIKLESSSHNNVISGNTVQGDGGDTGINLNDSNNCTITSNSASNNWRGIALWGSDYNNVQMNTLRSSGDSSISIGNNTSDNNLVSNNDCYGDKQITDSGVGTSFGAGNRKSDGTWDNTAG